MEITSPPRHLLAHNKDCLLKQMLPYERYYSTGQSHEIRKKNKQNINRNESKQARIRKFESKPISHSFVDPLPHKSP